MTVGNDWFVSLRNGGTGDLTVTPQGAETINGGASLVLGPGDSATLVTDGLVWFTIGLSLWLLRERVRGYQVAGLLLAIAAQGTTLQLS